MKIKNKSKKSKVIILVEIAVVVLALASAYLDHKDEVDASIAKLKNALPEKEAEKSDEDTTEEDCTEIAQEDKGETSDEE